MAETTGTSATTSVGSTAGTVGTAGESTALWMARRLEAAHALDAPANALAAQVSRVLRARPGLADTLHGRPLGHAAHPLMTDLPLGLWTGATVLDLVGGPSAGPAADRLLGLGVLLAVPTAATGAADWAESDERVRRVGLVHAALNKVALVLYGTSWCLRRSGRRRAGVLSSLTAGVVVTVSGYLGGHMSYRLGAPPRTLSGPPEA
jgi:uncharacterized membrane protein